MLTFRFFGADGVMTVPEKITTGMVGKEVRFEFSSDWDGLTKTAVYLAGEVSVAEHNVGEINEIPPEVLTVPKHRLCIGIYGESEAGELIIPTIYAQGPRIERGADPYSAAAGKTPLPKWKELEDRIDSLEKNGGGIGGTTDHSKLSNRDAADQHPIEAIVGLSQKLKDLGSGSSGIHVGPDEPTDENIVVWINPDAEAADLPDSYTKAQIDAIMGAYINDIDALIGGDS